MRNLNVCPVDIWDIPTRSISIRSYKTIIHKVGFSLLLLTNTGNLTATKLAILSSIIVYNSYLYTWRKTINS